MKNKKISFLKYYRQIYGDKIYHLIIVSYLISLALFIAVGAYILSSEISKIELSIYLVLIVPLLVIALTRAVMYRNYEKHCRVERMKK